MTKKIIIINVLIILVGVGGGVYTASNQHSWTDGLVDYWSFDDPMTTFTDEIRDVSENNNWGTFSGGIKPVGGIFGQALSFDMVDDYVDCWDDESSQITDNLTTEAWVKWVSKKGTIISKGTGTGYTQMWTFKVINDENLRFESRDTAGTGYGFYL
jgi:hypothetical protein